MVKVLRNDWGKLSQLLTALANDVPDRGRAIVEEAARFTSATLKQNLQEQGRGGSGPPLSPATRRIYQLTGEPDGSGLVNHIQIVYRYTRRNGAIAIVGIPEGRPTIIAKVQDQGAYIPVTDAMRGYLSYLGIHLRGDTKFIRVPGRGAWTDAVRQGRSKAVEELAGIFSSLRRL